MDLQELSITVVEALRMGKVPYAGVELYTVGNEKLIGDIKRYHISGIKNHGIIRFINGSNGNGKTHFLRLLREVAFQSDCLVSNFDLSKNDASLNKFETIFFAIVKNITTPSYYHTGGKMDIAPFGVVLKESLAFLSSGTRELGEEIVFEHFSKANERLFADHSIDIDFKKMIRKYWETFLPDSVKPEIREQLRSEILEWFAGEGQITKYRKLGIDINKMPRKENAKVMLQSLAGFVQLSGYRGLLIELDEAEMSYSRMQVNQWKDACNNLLSLINNIELVHGLFLIYATTPDFYRDPKHGIPINKALEGRIGVVPSHPPKALNIIWNFDEVITTDEDFQTAAIKIRNVYIDAYPESKEKLVTETGIREFVKDFQIRHGSHAPIGFWRVMVTALIHKFDDNKEDEVRSNEELYFDVMDTLREGN